MNKLGLDKLVEFCQLSINHHMDKQKNILLNDEIIKIKQNMSLNEGNNFNKYNFVSISNIIPNFKYNENILLFPLCFKIDENHEWFNFLNCCFLVLHDEYIRETNVIKKNILYQADKIYRNKVTLEGELNNNIFKNICLHSDFNFIIVSLKNDTLNVDKFEEKNNTSKNTEKNKWIVCLKFKNEYFPFWNFKTKYYETASYFITYLKTLVTNGAQKDDIKNTNCVKDTFINTTNGTKNNNIHTTENLSSENNTNTINTINTINTNNTNNTKDKYEEFITNDDYTLLISEGENLKKEKNKSNMKKKSKKNKDIFVNMENGDNENKDNSVFKNTEILDINKILETMKNIKSNIKLEELQKYSMKLGINIFAGSTKNGKPKQKTKSDLFLELKKLQDKYMT